MWIDERGVFMKTMLENDRVILCPEGRIDSNNALTVEAEMFSELKALQDMTTHYLQKRVPI